ncbi:hypothetical protein [Brevibacillus choshinensis]|uniref:Uncharacterized protein n=1 Tax=Brevibacillus choshinensis TaxID=54911 RepID=A0ABX7FNN9_BRECH|nr:hypothetical protein [Brevibacillus choshinensis]QRG67846.1 hypothetical protein JNE38_01045 [Brevibacillus choshinensis]
MKIIVCYPMKSLAKTYMPDSSEALVAETSEEFFRYVQHYQPDAAVVFSEMFSAPAWEWLPSVKASLSDMSPLLIIPLYRDEALIQKVAEEMKLQGVYVLSAQLSQEEIRNQISLILGLEDDAQVRITGDRQGIVYALMSYGSSGITTFCINYPVVLAKQNPDKRIAVLDMNEAKPDLTRFFKLQKHQLALFRPDFLDANSAKKRNWMSVCKQSAHLPNLYYAHAATRWKSSEMTNLISAFRHQFDFVYLDWGYCFPESETLQRMIFSADRNLLFVRADPFSLENARQWIHSWRERGVTCEVLLSHLDKGQPFRIGEDIALYGVVPRIHEGRLMQSHRSSSVLVEEFLPPKPYLTSLKQIAEAESFEKSVVLA